MFGPLRKPSRRLARVNRQATELRRRRGRAIFREELSRARFRELPDSRLMIRPRRAEAEIRGASSNAMDFITFGSARRCRVGKRTNAVTAKRRRRKTRRVFSFVSTLTVLTPPGTGRVVIHE